MKVNDLHIIASKVFWKTIVTCHVDLDIFKILTYMLLNLNSR